jgi:putative thiamine transport system ATP-binding protein
MVSGLDAEDRRIGLMFQDPLLFPHMTVGDNLAIALAAHHHHDRKARVSAALELAGLAGFEDRDPATLSGGQAARVALMRTLLAEPEALLMDEAFSALDPDLRHAFGGFVRTQIRDRGIPALLVSHDAADAVFADDGIIRI